MGHDEDGVGQVKRRNHHRQFGMVSGQVLLILRGGHTSVHTVTLRERAFLIGTDLKH